MRTILVACAGLLLAAAEPAAERSEFLRRLAGAPAVQAAQERVAAARRAAGAAGRLPDPMLGAGYSRKSNAMDRWPMYEVMLEQPLPRWGERDARRALAAAATAMGEAELLDALGETAAEVAAQLADAAAARARLALAERQLGRARALRQAAVARLASGGGALAEQLAVDSRIAALEVERATLRSQVEDAEQEARTRLGLGAEAALPPFAAPERGEVDPARAPEVRSAQARSAEAEAMLGEARAGRYPETALALRFERERQPADTMDTIGLELRVSLPVWQGASGELEAAAAARRRAARREAAGGQLRAQALVARAGRAAAVAAAAHAAAQGTRDRLDAEYDAVVRAAAAQGAGLAAALDVLDRLGDAEGRLIDAEAAARVAAAGLWRLAPPSPGEPADAAAGTRP